MSTHDSAFSNKRKLTLVVIAVLAPVILYAATWAGWFALVCGAQADCAEKHFATGEEKFELASQLSAPFAKLDFRNFAVRYALACTYTLDGKAAQAEPILRQLEAESKQPNAPQLIDRAEILNALGSLCVSKYEHNRAAPLFLEASEILKQKGLLETTKGAQYLNSTGKTLRDRGSPEKGLPYFEEALRIREKVCGLESAEVEMTLHDLGHCYYLLADMDKAAQAFTRARDLAIKLHGDKSETAVKFANDLASTEMARGNQSKAQALLEESLSKQDPTFEHHSVSFCLGRLAYILQTQGETDTSRALYQAAKRLNQLARQEDDPDFQAAMRAYEQLQGQQKSEALPRSQMN